MSQTLKERLSLRQLRQSLNTKLFGRQNFKLAKALDIDPAWIHQSRLNFRYIFNRLDAFWPDWAIAQFSPYADSSTPPKHELSCLNTTARETFSFFTSNKHHRMDINSHGFISFPFLHWGISLQTIEADTFHSFFKSQIHLDPIKHLIQYSYQHQQKATSSFKLSYDEDTELTHIEITYKNTSDQLVQESLNVGMIPYTNEGIGGIRSIQTTSDHQMIINDSSIVSVSPRPNNIVCTSYSQGNVFECSKKWDMILSSRCDDFLASGLFNFTLDLAPKKTTSVFLTIQHTKPLITPVLFPLQKLNRFLLSKPTSMRAEHLNDTLPITPFSMPKLPAQYQSLPLIIQNYALTIPQNTAIYTTEDLYFTLYSLMQLQAKPQLQHLLRLYGKTPHRFSCLSYLSQNQTLCFNHLLVIDQKYNIRFSMTHFVHLLKNSASENLICISNHPNTFSFSSSFLFFYLYQKKWININYRLNIVLNAVISVLII